MKIYLLLVLFVVSFKAVTSCERICEFLYNNSDWQNHTSINDMFFEITVERGRVAGIISASLELFSPDYGADFDFLRVYALPSGETSQPLSIRIEKDDDIGRFQITGTDENGTLKGKTSASYRGTTQRLQVGPSPHYNKIHVGPGDDNRLTITLEHIYKDLEVWNWFQKNNMRLQDTVRIKNDGRCTVYKFLSVCSDATPRLCDEQATVTEAGELGSCYNLSWTGPGPLCREA